MEEVEIKIVHATALEPGKVYLIEMDAEAMPVETANHLARAFDVLGIKGIIAWTVGGHAIMVKEVQSAPVPAGEVGRPATEAVCARQSGRDLDG